jgi:hypothetical protein
MAFECAKTHFGAGTMTGSFDRLTSRELYFHRKPQSPKGAPMTDDFNTYARR